MKIKEELSNLLDRVYWGIHYRLGTIPGKPRTIEDKLDRLRNLSCKEGRPHRTEDERKEPIDIEYEVIN